MLKTLCPSCGVELIFESKASPVAVCAECGCAAIREDINVRDLGKVADLQEDGTPLQLGVKGAYRERPFTIIGRCQIAYDKGFWNEWFLDFNAGQDGRLVEAMGFYSVLFLSPVSAERLSPDTLKIGGQVNLGETRYFVRSILRASCVAAEGELPMAVGGKTEMTIADLAAENQQCATLEFGTPAPRIFSGEFVPFPQLSLSGLRALEGW